MRLFAIAVVLLLTATCPASAHTVLLEAESFANRGGWAVDQQFMDQMGSPYLLAHGLGTPVADATTTVTFPATGTYRVFVRTMDWVARWNAPGHPGRFQVLIDRKPLSTLFGTRGADWTWHDGGTVTIAKRQVALALHDLTGFNGRCDAIMFATDMGFRPPNDLDAMRRFRHKALGLPDAPADAGQFDLVVVGGGVAGTCAAVSAARLGVKVALVQDRPVLGGNNSSEVRVWLGGQTNYPPYPHIGELVRELDPRTRTCPAPAANYGDDTKLALVKTEKNISLFLNYHANKVETHQGRIAAVVAPNVLTGRRLRFAAPLFADCTGDGTIGSLAGADFEMTEKGHMGPTNLWRVVDTGKPSPFPRCPWAIDVTNKPFPDNLNRLGKWFWETGFDLHPITKVEYMRDTNLRAMFGAWDCLKNVRRKYPNHKLEWAAYVTGKRESRRLLGDVVLSKDDLMSGRSYPDGCVPTSWSIDLHLPHPRYVKAFKDNPFISTAKFTKYKRPYWVPYRCLYSRNVANLFMAGRNISVSHEALGTVRVMRTTGMMGEVVGRAAAVCKRRNALPRDVYASHLPEFLTLCRTRLSVPKPVPPPAYLKKAGKNLAPAARVSVSGTRPSSPPPAAITDGVLDTSRNDLRWLSTPKVPHWVELAWAEPQAIGLVRIVSGYFSGGRVADPIADFELQYHNGTEWRSIPGATVRGNRETDWHKAFPAVTTRRLRLRVTRTQINISRIWEIEVYGPEASEPKR